jgi:HSP20 family protein
MLSLRPVRAFKDNPTSLDRIFGDNFNRFFNQIDQELTSERSFSPAVDIYEAHENLVFTCELPGFEKEDIEINVDNGRLTISGERKFEEQEGRDYHRLERWYGKFFRSFQLPTTVDVNNISANLKNGVLTVSVPKREEARPRQIEVTA